MRTIKMNFNRPGVATLDVRQIRPDGALIALLQVETRRERRPAPNDHQRVVVCEDLWETLVEVDAGSPLYALAAAGEAEVLIETA